MAFCTCFGKRDAFISPEESKIKERLVEALRAKKAALDAEGGDRNLTRIMLKLGRIRRFLQDVKVSFDTMDKDKSGKIDQEEFAEALKALNVTMQAEEVNALFKLAEQVGHIGGAKELNMKQFMTCLAVGHLLEVMPSNLRRELEDVSKRVSGDGKEQPSTEQASLMPQAMDLIAEAYLLFDPEVDGYIKASSFERATAGQAEGPLTKERWQEMDWDSDGQITFEEFAHCFSRWVNTDDDDADDE
ncbi:unnamed protein product [Chrysoparadoxa australica]